MAQESTTATDNPADLVQGTQEIVGVVSRYGDLIIESIVWVMVGILAIYLIHKLADKFLFPHIHKGRLVKVIGITVYALILVVTALVVLESVGVNVAALGRIAFVTIFIIAVLVFFAMPFLPKLPFRIGQLVELKGELGTVTAISPLFTTLEKFDGTLLFIPNTSIISMTIKNYSQLSTRRVKIHLSVQNDKDLDRTKESLVKLMSEDERVVDQPSGPEVYVMKANAVFIDLLAVCWVNNEDWFSTQCDLWEKIINSCQDIHLAKPLVEC
jgi:small conductance mechanosensitive channel